MQITTERLILRKAKKTDWQDILEGFSEYDVVKMTGAPHPYKKKDADLYISNAIAKWGKRSYYFFIQLKAEKKVIGVVELTGISSFDGTASTASWINKKYWRQGYVAEAKIAINDFAFYKLKLRRLGSGVFATNKASNATQQKMGYVLEGVKRRCLKNRTTGKIHDVNMYGLLKENWKKARIKLLKKE